MADDGVDIYAEDIGGFTDDAGPEDISLYDDIGNQDNKAQTDLNSKAEEEEHPRDNQRITNEGAQHDDDNVDHYNQTAVFVSNLTWWTTETDLDEIFSKHGKVRELRILLDKINGLSRGKAIVHYAGPGSAQSAVKDNGIVVHGRELSVQYVSPELLKPNAAIRMPEMGQPNISKYSRPPPSGPSGSYRGGYQGNVSNDMGSGPNSMSLSGPIRGRGRGYRGSYPPSSMPMDMMMRGGYRGRGRGYPPPSMPMGDPRMMPAPHVNPSFFEKRTPQEESRGPEPHPRSSRYHRSRSRSRSRSPRPRSRSRSRSRERHRRSRSPSKRDRSRDRESHSDTRPREPSSRDREDRSKRHKESSSSSSHRSSRP